MHCKCARAKWRDSQALNALKVWLAVAVALAAFGILKAHATELPTADQIQKAVTDTHVAWQDWVAIWGLIYPLLVAIPAMSKNIQNIPVLGPLLNVLAFNVGAAKNVK